MNKGFFKDLSLLKVGDRIYEDAIKGGPYSGGALYGCYETVTKLTDTEIFTESIIKLPNNKIIKNEARYDRITGIDREAKGVGIVYCQKMKKSSIVETIKKFFAK